MEAQPERHWKHKQLLYLVGYYALILDTTELSPDWKVLYEQRLAEVKEELENYE